MKSTLVKQFCPLGGQKGAQILRPHPPCHKHVNITRVEEKHVSWIGIRGRLDSTESLMGGLPAEVPKILAKPLGNKTNAYDNSYALAA